MHLLFQGTCSSIYRLEAWEEFAGPVILKVLDLENAGTYHLECLNNEFHLSHKLAQKAPFAGVRKVLSKTIWYGSQALVLEYVPGETLTKFFCEPRSLDCFLEVAAQVARALDQIHQAGIVHKDINPQNILIHPESQDIKLIDFGLAVSMGQDADEGMGQGASLPEVSGLVGTLAYISPEQTGRTSQAVDARSDLYSLGVTLYELLTGQRPFEAEDSLGMVHAHIAKLPAPPAELLEAQARDTELSQELVQAQKMLSNLILKLLAKNPEDRYQTALGLCQDLRHCRTALAQTRTIADFPLGREEHLNLLPLPRQLYGREQEKQTLLASLARVTESGSGAGLLLISGASGVGKTFLVQELQEPLRQQQGYLIFGGKYDQLRRQIPYAAFFQGITQLLRQLLGGSPESLASWKDRILAAVGKNGRVLTEMLPELALLLGEQPPITQLGALEAHNRFNHVWLKFIQALCLPQHPLVLFIDDLQWADSASLHLLKRLVKSPQIQGLLIIGAFRDNELDAGHPFQLLLNELDEVPDQETVQIALGNLELASVRQLVNDTLHRLDDECEALVELVYEKTQGNAFFVHQFLSSLHQAGLLRYDPSGRRWVWDIQEIRLLDVTDNVGLLLTAKLRRMPAETQSLLMLAACLGNQFDARILELLSDQTDSPTVSAGLQPAIEAGLVLPLTQSFRQDGIAAEPEQSDSSWSSYRFLHDRIQQACYAQIPESERAPLHLRIGRRLLEKLDEKQ
ncbi:MAG TPA: AAA family ATPase, partial [Candidatus Obscuribacterales bacterium]